MFRLNLSSDPAQPMHCTCRSVLAALSICTMSPPACHICSYAQPRPDKPVKVYHLHNSSRHIRQLMGVEGHEDNPLYLCPTCQAPHSARPTTGLNVCVSTSQLHNFHFPREDIVVSPDTLHTDWITIPGATIKQLSFAWRIDYHKEPRPQRVLLVAGLNDLIKVGSAEELKESVLDFEEVVRHQNRYHAHLGCNELYVAPLLIPPKLAWFPDNGPMPHGFENRLKELQDYNTWVKELNTRNGVKGVVPNFQAWGTRTWTDNWGQVRRTHRWNDWRASEPDHDKLHLKDSLRAKMGKSVVKFFQGELDRKGPLV